MVKIGYDNYSYRWYEENYRTCYCGNRATASLIAEEDGRVLASVFVCEKCRETAEKVLIEEVAE